MGKRGYADVGRGKRFSDGAGRAADREVRNANHMVSGRGFVPENRVRLRAEVRRFLGGGDDVLLLTGGTGVGHRDVTMETVRPFFEKELTGFGELLRRLSYTEVGSAAVLLRAAAGVARGKLILCMPASPKAVSITLKAFIGELPHAVFIARKLPGGEASHPHHRPRQPVAP